MKRGTFQLMKSVNKSIVLNKIRLDAPISRAQIAKETNLTPPTVSTIVKELLRENMIIERKSDVSMGGRKPLMLHINDQAYFIIGVDAGPEQIAGIVADLSGNILNRHYVSLEKPLDRKTFLTLLKTCIEQLITDQKRPSEDYLGIGVAMHGIVDVKEGISKFAPNIGLKNIPIKEVLEKEFQMNVKVENDARLMALGESWFGGHGSLERLIAINFGRGVGGGIILNGELYHGAHDIAGEIGHMMIDPEGDICECGNQGCLQTFATGPAIVRRAKQKLNDSNKSHIPLSGEKIFALAKAGHSIYQETLRETAQYIGVGLTNVIHLLNPDKVVLGGGVMNSAEIILPTIRDIVAQRSLTEEAKNTVVVTQLGQDATLLGAISQFLVELYA